MENANSPMMARIAEIENCILGGFVLDDWGNWVSIADKKTSEGDFLVHLEAGRVLHNGHWVNFSSAKTAPLIPFTAPGAAREQETTAGQYPPETKVMEMLQSPVPETQEPATDDPSNYAVETGLFMVEHTHEAGPAKSLTPPAVSLSQPSGERKVKSIPAIAPRSMPTWEKEDSQQKKRTLIIGGVIVAVMGIAVIVVVVLQVFH